MGGSRFEIRECEVRVGGRLQPDELDAVGWSAGLVELDNAESPVCERGERDPGAVVAAAGERDRVAGLEQRQDERRRRACAGGEEQRGTAVELAQRGLGGRDRRAAEALVVKLRQLAMLVVRPDRGPVERLHRSSLYRLWLQLFEPTHVGELGEEPSPRG